MEYKRFVRSADHSDLPPRTKHDRREVVSLMLPFIFPFICEIAQSADVFLPFACPMSHETVAIQFGDCQELRPQLVLDEVNLEVAAGETVVLTGANGAGKTTLLGCLASLLRPRAGKSAGSVALPAGDPEAAGLLAWWPTRPAVSAPELA